MEIFLLVWQNKVEKGGVIGKIRKKQNDHSCTNLEKSCTIENSGGEDGAKGSIWDELKISQDTPGPDIGRSSSQMQIKQRVLGKDGARDTSRNAGYS